MSILVPLPILAPLMTAILTIFLGQRYKPKAIVSLVGSGLTFGLSLALLATVARRGIVIHAMGDWPPPYGIILVADLLSASLAVLTSGLALVALCYSVGYVSAEGQRRAYHPLFHFLIMGINGAFLTGDIFNLFVFFEILLISSYALVAFFGEDYQLEATLKYATINLVGSALFLIAVGSLYGVVGTLNMADLSQKVSALPNPGPLLAIFLLLLAVFGIKASMFPLHFWLPDAHSSAPTPISALLSGILIKVGAYCMLRVGRIVFHALEDEARPILLTLAAVTMVVGALGALAQSDIKRLLAYSSVSQMAYILLGIGLGSPLALRSTLLLLVNHAIGKALLFLSAGLVIEMVKSRDMARMGGLGRRHPWVAACFFVGAMGIAGVPPMLGFFAKFFLLQAAMDAGHVGLAVLGVGMALFTLWYLFRAWQRIFWGEPAVPHGGGHHLPRLMVTPVMGLGGLFLALSLFPDPLATFLTRVAEQMAGPAQYVQAVMTFQP